MPAAGDSLSPAIMSLGLTPTRTVVIRDDRDEIVSGLLRYGDASGVGWTDVIDTLTMHPDVRRQAVWLAGCP